MRNNARGIAGGIADAQASTIANGIVDDKGEANKGTDYQSHETITTIDSDIVNGIAGGIADREVGILDLSD